MDDNNIDGSSSPPPSSSATTFLSSLSEPLLTYASRAFSNNNNNNDSSSSGERLDELEISTRSHLLEIVERLDDGDGTTTTTTTTIGELMRYLKDVTLLCSSAAGHYSSSSSSSSDQEGESSTSTTTTTSTSLYYPHPPTSLAAVKRLPFLLLEDAIDSLPLALVQTLWSGGGGGGKRGKGGKGGGLGEGEDRKKEDGKEEEEPHVSSYATSLLCSPPIFDNVQSKLSLLRICNKVLRTIGSIRGGEGESEFAGGVMLMLSKAFPLGERSAVNVLGTFNVMNVTKFDNNIVDGGGGDGDDASMGGGAGAGGDHHHHHHHHHYLYEKFWGLQRSFSDPHGTILPSSRGGAGSGGLGQSDAADAFDAFLRDVSSVLAALESTPVLPGGGDGGASSSSSSSLSDAMIATTTTTATTMTASRRRHKYLTAPSLLTMQLGDARLRLHFLTQLLIVLSHLGSPNVSLPGGPAAHPARRNQLARAEKRATALLRYTTTPSSSSSSGEGTTTTRCVRWILRDRESMWRAWKRAKCMPALDFVGGGGGGGVAAAAGRGIATRGRSAIGDASRGGRKRKKAAASSADADVGAEDAGGVGRDDDDDDDDIIRISTLPKITSRITESLPTLETFLDPYVEALDPENGIEGEYHPRNDKVYCWRALRMLARDQGNLGQLCRFGKLRRRDGDFEGIVRDMWKGEDRGDIGGSTLDADYYAEDAGRHEADGEEDKVDGGDDDALEMMDDVSVGTPEEETQARLDKQAEFERVAMEVEEEMLYEDLNEVEVILPTKAGGDGKIVGEGLNAENAITADAKTEEDKDLKEKISIQDAAAETLLLMTKGGEATGMVVEEEPEKPVSKGKSPVHSSKKTAQPASAVNEESKSDPEKPVEKDKSPVQSSKKTAQPASAVNEESKSSKVVKNTGTIDSKTSGDDVNHKGKTFTPGTNKWSRNDDKTSASKETSKASYSSGNGKKDDHKNEENTTSSTPRAKFTPPQKVQEHQQQEVEPGRDTSTARYSWRRGSQADGRGRDGKEQQPQQQQQQVQQQSRITPTHNQSKWDAPPAHNQRKWDGRDDGSRSAHHRGVATDSVKGRDAKSLSPALNSTNNLPSGNGNDVGVGPPHGGAVGAKGRGGWEPPRGGGREGSHGRGAGRGRGYHERNNERSNERSNNSRDRR